MEGCGTWIEEIVEFFGRERGRLLHMRGREFFELQCRVEKVGKGRED